MMRVLKGEIRILGYSSHGELQHAEVPPERTSCLRSSSNTSLFESFSPGNGT